MDIGCGWRGFLIISPDSPISTICPRCITAILSETYCVTVISCEINIIDLFNFSFKLIKMFKMSARRDTSSIETGSSATIKSGSLMTALAIPTLCL